MKIFFFDIETVPTDESLQENGLLDPQIKLDEAELLKKLSLSATTAKILCLAYAIDPPADSPINVLEGEETAIIRNFWKLAMDANLFVGHNVLDFDLRFIWQRSIIHQIKPPRDIPFTRFRNDPIFDTMQEWSKWGREHVSLDSCLRPWESRRRRKASTARRSIRTTVPANSPRFMNTANATSIPSGRFTGGCRLRKIPG